MKRIPLVVCICLLLSGCYAAQLVLGAIELIANIASSGNSDDSRADACKGKSVLWDPGKKRYYCYDDEGNKVYKR